MVSPAILAFDLPFMIAVAFACLPIFFTGHRIDRWEGGLFLAYYGAYTLLLALHATHHALARPVAVALLGFAVPMTAVTLTVLVVRAARRTSASEDLVES